MEETENKEFPELVNELQTFHDNCVKGLKPHEGESMVGAVWQKETLATSFYGEDVCVARCIIEILSKSEGVFHSFTNLLNSTPGMAEAMILLSVNKAEDLNLSDESKVTVVKTLREIAEKIEATINKND